MHPSRRAIFLVALGTVLATLPVLISSQLWVAWLFFWAATLLLIAVDAVLVPRASDLEHQLSLPDMLYMGESPSLDLALSVRASRRVVTDVKLDLSDSLEPVTTRRVRLGRKATSVRFPLTPRRRGMAEIEAAWLRYAGPFGLVNRTLRLDLSRPIDAVPNLRGVRTMALKFASPNEMHVGLRIEQFSGDGSEFDSLREFMAGMDKRAIDWKSSARHHKLLSRQFRAERNRQIIVAVDTGRLMAEPLDGIPRLDHAIHAALLLAYLSVRTGDRVGMYAFAERPGAYSAPRAAMGGFRTMLKLTGGLDYGEAETNYTLGLTSLMSRLNRRSLVIVLTDFVDSVTAELMVDNVLRLAKRHLVVFVSLRDPLLAELGATPPTDAIALNTAVVADSLVRERELVLVKLRRKGIFCIDAPPKEVGIQLLNRYLQIKRREMI